MRRRDSDRLFLLALCVAGCPAGESDDESGSSGTTGQPSPGTGAQDTGTSTGGAMETTETSSSSTGGNYEYYDCDEVMPPEVGAIEPVCDAFGALMEECYQPTEDCQPLYAALCQEYLDHAQTQGAECLTALEEFYACTSQLDCMMLRDRVECEDEFDAYYLPCGPS